MTEFRPTGARRLYSPNRDLLVVYEMVIRAALESTINSFSEEELSMEEFDKLVSAAANIPNQSLDSKPADEILREFIKTVKGLDQAMVLRFLEFFTTSVISHYIYSIRDSSALPELSEEEIKSSMVGMGVWALLDPRENRQIVSQMITSGMLKPAYAKPTGLYVKVNKHQEEKDATEKPDIR